MLLAALHEVRMSDSTCLRATSPSALQRLIRRHRAPLGPLDRAVRRHSRAPHRHGILRRFQPGRRVSRERLQRSERADLVREGWLPRAVVYGPRGRV